MKHLSYLARETMNSPYAKYFKSWGRVVNTLEKAGYNGYEVRAIAKSDLISHLGLINSKTTEGSLPYTALVKFLTASGYTPRCVLLNELVMKTFSKKDGLEYNDEGVVCHRGTMPGNYDPKKTILVPVGTPACCSPLTETYWCM